MELSEKSCRPCEGTESPLPEEEVQKLLQKIPGWELKDGKVRKAFRFRNFRESMGFVNKVAELAEEEGHHPNITIKYNKVVISLITHAIGGLSENDFIMASKVSRLHA